MAHPSTARRCQTTAALAESPCIDQQLGHHPGREICTPPCTSFPLATQRQGTAAPATSSFQAQTTAAQIQI